jgi:hypothetical protein
MDRMKVCFDNLHNVLVQGDNIVPIVRKWDIHARNITVNTECGLSLKMQAVYRLWFSGNWIYYFLLGFEALCSDLRKLNGQYNTQPSGVYSMEKLGR